MSYTPRRPLDDDTTPTSPGLALTAAAAIGGALAAAYLASRTGAAPAGTAALIGGALAVVGLHAHAIDEGARPNRRSDSHSWVGWRIYLRPRLWWRYGRKWEPVMQMSGLAVDYRRRRYLPKLVRVERTAHMDRLHVRLPYGQKPADLMAAAEELGHSYRRRAARVRSDVERPGWATIDMIRTDLLVAPVPIPLPEVDAPVDLERMPVGKLEDGRAWLAKLIYMHSLVAGRTGAGKGSVLWSHLIGTGPLIRAGLVQWWLIDPKGGMEFGGPGERLYHRFATGDPEDQAQLLRDAVALLRRRAATLAGKTRKHVPGPQSPLVVILIDELAALIAYNNGPRPLRWEMVANLNILLTQGRAVGVLCICAIQDPRKAVLESRDLFPNKIALGLDDGDMALGKGAEAKGARTRDLNKPGELYVWVEGEREPVRGRAFMVTDDDIRRAAHLYAPDEVAIARARELVGAGGGPVALTDSPEIHPDLAQVLDVPWAAGPRQPEPYEETPW